ncbi:MAG: hypothetical protein E7622_00690 [Ruminococcaceae bacterium]|nr:hypothetical protein [Oscillospiraceae bacterium]
MNAKRLISNMLVFSCAIFAPLTLFTDLFIGFFISKTGLLSLGATLSLLIIAFAISAFVVILKDGLVKPLERAKMMWYSFSFYTCISVILKIIVYLINVSKKVLWSIDIYSIIIIAVFSALISALLCYLKLQSFSIKALIYFVTVGIFYYLITVTIGGLDVGNNLILILGIYIGAFVLCTIFTLLIKRLKETKQRESQKYKNQF